MKSIGTYLLALSLLTTVACAQASEGEANGKVEAKLQEYFSGDTFEDDQFGEKIRIQGNSIELHKVRQVGSDDNPNVPYPTVCSYVVKGKINDLYVRSEQERKEYWDLGTHQLSFTFNSVSLTDDLEAGTVANPHCQNFAKEMNQEAYLGYSNTFEVLNENQIRMHTSGGGDYTQGGERTESTLDEVFTRINESKANAE
ncbi:MAG: hypothetical protein H6625_07385 [Bdellovibrionaceae bacterium]|nr:hypothetical protein [Pseudobdellovibrionaceae bacterium]